MRLKIPVLLSLWCSLNLLPVAPAHAQPAEEFFHGGAQSYITNNVANARALVDAGLKLYPDDVKLKKLDELLKQQSQQQQQQDQNQQQQKQDQQQDQKNQDQKNQQNKNQPDKGDQQKQDQSKQPPKDPEQKNKQDQQGKPGDDKKDEQREGTPVQAQQMTPAEAERLLDGEKGNEKVLVLQPPGNEKPENPDHPRKDW